MTGSIFHRGARGRFVLFFRVLHEQDVFVYSRGFDVVLRPCVLLLLFSIWIQCIMFSCITDILLTNGPSWNSYTPSRIRVSSAPRGSICRKLCTCTWLSLLFKKQWVSLFTRPDPTLHNSNKTHQQQQQNTPTSPRRFQDGPRRRFQDAPSCPKIDSWCQNGGKLGQKRHQK